MCAFVRAWSSGFWGRSRSSTASASCRSAASKRRAVVAALLLHPNRVVSAEQLIDLVWGDDPPAAALGSLQNHVLRLRRELGDRLVTRAPGYLVRVEPGELDLDRFRGLVEEARAGEPEEAGVLLEKALALWRGDPLADLAGEPVGASAAHLAELRLEAIESRIDADLALGRHAPSCRSSRRSSVSNPSASACARSSCSRSTSRAGKRTRSTRTAPHGQR